MNVFARKLIQEKSLQEKKINKEENNAEIVIDKKPSNEPGIKYDEGITILEALSATGLRSIRYAREISGLKEIVANDISRSAVEDIKSNIADNNVNHLVTASHDNAT